jgi:hypothetical protein
MAYKMLGGLAAALALTAAMAATNVAHADFLTGTYTITVYQGTGDGTSTDPIEQATNANPLFSTAVLGTVSYTGALDFSADTNNSLGAFLTSGGGSIIYSNSSLAGLMLSTGNFQLTTLLSITGTSAGATNGTVTHDDGESMYQFGNTVSSSPAPTSATQTAFALQNGAFQLDYVEANGLPADLIVNTVPEPATIAVMAAGLLGLCFMRRRFS